jgi:hypothetical protein
MFHGTNDGVVPFDEGYPFTFNIFLPFVYGSNQIFFRLNELGIESTLIFETGEGHEYWGTSNGTWNNGPNEYFESIKDLSYSFLFDIIYPFDIGDINNDGNISNLDYLGLIPVILNQDWTNAIFYYCDLNYDEAINILDLIILIDRLS